MVRAGTGLMDTELNEEGFLFVYILNVLFSISAAQRPGCAGPLLVAWVVDISWLDSEESPAGRGGGRRLRALQMLLALGGLSVAAALPQRLLPPHLPAAPPFLLPGGPARLHPDGPCCHRSSPGSGFLTGNPTAGISREGGGLEPGTLAAEGGTCSGLSLSPSHVGIDEGAPAASIQAKAAAAWKWSVRVHTRVCACTRVRACV